MALRRVAQVGLKVEGSEGVEETLVAADFSGNRKETSDGLTINRYDRALMKGSLSAQQSLPGQRSFRVNFVEELCGGGAATAAPWHSTIRGLGWGTPVQLKVMTLGTVTNGPFKVGQRIGDNATEGSATKTGTAVYQTSDSPAKLVYVPGTGTFADTDTVYNYGVSPQASAPIDSTPANAGYRLRPQSESDSAVPASLTMQHRLAGEKRIGIGCRGTGGLTIRVGEPYLLRGEFTGAPLFDPALPGVWADSALMASVPVLPTAPKVAVGTPCTFRVGATDYKPVLPEFAIDFGNTIAPRPTIGDSLASSGHLAARITGRRITASLEPEYVSDETFDFIGYLVNGGTFEFIHQLGTQSHANGLILIHGPQVMFDGDAEIGDRDGMLTQPTSLVFTGDVDDELSIYHIFV